MCDLGANGHLDTRLFLSDGRDLHLDKMVPTTSMGLPGSQQGQKGKCAAKCPGERNRKHYQNVQENTDINDLLAQIMF